MARLYPARLTAAPRRRPRRALGIAAAGSFLQVLPAASWLPTVRRLAPNLAGLGSPDHVALTFDDGPDAGRTPQILDVLATHGVRATFFLTGERAGRHPDLLRRIVAEGHELGVHGWRHTYALWSSPHLGRCLRVVEEASGVRPRWFRPPYGVLSATAWLESSRHRLRPVLWTAWGKDWQPNADADSVLALLGPGITGGATVLLHDGREGRASEAHAGGDPTVEVLPRLLALCKERDLAVGTLSEHFDTYGDAARSTPPDHEVVTSLRRRTARARRAPPPER